MTVIRSPGASTRVAATENKAPVDPIAAKFAQEYGMTCHLLRGTNITNFKKYLDGKAFTGSTIHP